MKDTNKMNNFTLLEVVLAIAIFMLVTGIGVMSLSSTEKTLRKVTIANKRLEIKQSIDRLVNRAFKNAVYFNWNDNNMRQQMVFTGKQHELLVCYLHRIDPTKNSGIRFLKLYQDENNLMAEYSPTPILPWLDNQENLNREVIATGVNQISFTYAMVNNQTKQIEMREAWDNDVMPYLPLGIQLKIEWLDGSNDVWFRRTAGAGYKQQLGIRRF